MAAKLFEMRERGIYRDMRRENAQVVLYGVHNNAVPKYNHPGVAVPSQTILIHMRDHRAPQAWEPRKNKMR